MVERDISEVALYLICSFNWSESNVSNLHSATCRSSLLSVTVESEQGLDIKQ
jgi:hypothetical protein